MKAYEEMALKWMPMAAKNDIVLVFPQVNTCWDNGLIAKP